MDISKWTRDQVMTLPDYAFGEKRIICADFFVPNATYTAFLCPMVLPSRLIVWEIMITPRGFGASGDWVRIVLSTKIPGTIAECLACAPLIPGLGAPENGPGCIDVADTTDTIHINLRQMVEAQGNRLCVVSQNAAAAGVYMFVTVLISTVPSEIPDWLAYHLDISR